MNKKKNPFDFITNFYLNFVNVQQLNMLDDHDHMELLLLNTRRKKKQNYLDKRFFFL